MTGDEIAETAHELNRRLTTRSGSLNGQVEVDALVELAAASAKVQRASADALVESILGSARKRACS